MWARGEGAGRPCGISNKKQDNKTEEEACGASLCRPSTGSKLKIRFGMDVVNRPLNREYYYCSCRPDRQQSPLTVQQDKTNKFGSHILRSERFLRESAGVDCWEPRHLGLIRRTLTNSHGGVIGAGRPIWG